MKMKMIILLMICMMGMACNDERHQNEQVSSINAQWKELVVFDSELPDGAEQRAPVVIFYSIQGDTAIDGISRGKLYFSITAKQEEALIGFIHIRDSKMYFRPKEGVALQDSYILLCDEVGAPNHDILMYDFTLEVNAKYNDCSGNYMLSNKNSISLGDEVRQQYTFSSSMYSQLKKCWIEGMGSTNNLFETITLPIADFYYKKLICFSQNDKILWLNPEFSDCDSVIKNTSLELK